VKNASLEPPHRPQADSAPGLISTFRDCAVKALPRTIVVLVLGNVVIGLLGTLWADMAPSNPPGWHGKALAEAPRSVASFLRRPWIREHQFVLVYSIFFVHLVRVRLMGATAADSSGSAGWLSRAGMRGAARGWFGLLVRNAVGAIFSAVALCWFQRMPLSQRLWNLLLQPVVSQLHLLATDIFGQSLASAVQNWVDWYAENRLRFNFWFFYLAAICDDLGLPNLKTLGKWVWARARRKLTRTAATSAVPDGSPVQPGPPPPA
jgi:hypothetical protein